MFRSILTVALFASLSGCCMGGTSTSSTDPLLAPSTEPAAAGGLTAACDNSANVSTCRDLSGGAFVLGEDFQRSLCLGTYTSGGTCPTAGVVGSCDDGSGTITRYYSTGSLPHTVDTARADCTIVSTSTFTAAP